MYFVHIMNTLTYHANSRMSAAIPMNIINSFRMNLIALKTKRSTKPIISVASIRSSITHHSLSFMLPLLSYSIISLIMDIMNSIMLLHAGLQSCFSNKSCAFMIC